MSFGIVYLSFGETYADCTIASLRSKAANAPKTPAMILTNRKQDLQSKLCKQYNIQVKYVEAANTSVREYKTQIYKYTPWDYTLLLDADCWINKELSGYFGLLDITPVALTHAFYHPSIGSAAHLGNEDKALTLKAMNNMELAPHYASGLMFFRSKDANVIRLFDRWNKEWQVCRGKDQGALMRAIVAEQVFPMVLARQHWVTDKQGSGVVSHRFGSDLPSMPRKDAKSPLKNRYIP